MTKMSTHPTARLLAPARESSPLIGRAGELQQVERLLAAAASGRGGALFVIGEPGIGKTRFVTEAAAVAGAAGLVAAHGRAGAAPSPVPYRPLVEALLSLARAGMLPETAALGPYGRTLARLVDDASGTTASTTSPLMIAEAVLRLVAVLGRERGCLLVIEDIHHSDDGTLAVIEYLLDHLWEQPAALLLTVGGAGGPARDLAAQARQRGAAAVVNLRPLEPPEVRELVAAELGVESAQVPDGLLHRVADSAGIPFVVRELLHEWRGLGADDARPLPAPAAVAASIRNRVTQLGPLGVRFMTTAALFGPRFPLLPVQHAAGCDDSELTAMLRAAVDLGLVVPDGAGGDWYALRHRMTGEVLLSDIGPGRRAGYARRAADAIADLHPGLPGAWCAQTAALYAHAGERLQAIGLYCEAAERATAEDTVTRAVTLLTRAHRLIDAGTPPEMHATVLERLLDAAVTSGMLSSAPAPGRSTEAPGDPDVPASRRAGLYARRAELAVLAGRPDEALRFLDTARRLLGNRANDACTAVVDLAAAQVEPYRDAPGGLHAARDCARRAAAAAGRAGQPQVACRALLVLEQLDRQGEERVATARLTHARTIARKCRFPALGVSADAHLARRAARQDGEVAGMEEVLREAHRRGVLPLALESGVVVALTEVQQCRFEEAGARIRQGLAEAQRLGLEKISALWWLALATRFAHQGRRAEMEDALAQSAPVMDAAAPHVRPVSYGMARGICSLLEERPELAEREFAQAGAEVAGGRAIEDFSPHAVVLLLDALGGRAGRDERARIAATLADGARWDRQFAGLADAVLLGREGRCGDANAAASAALEAADRYPTGRRLCLRLVARAAYEDGWGDPVAWLREAEEYFHGAGLRAVAGACRAQLRTMGAPVRYRRTGIENVPSALRRHGVTVREFEVARLLAERIGNKEIARRLHISPRTVEKHVASLLQKTGHPTRASFAQAGRLLVTGGGAVPDATAAAGSALLR